MKWECMRHCYSRTSVNEIPFGPACDAALEHRKLHSPGPILCVRKQTWNHIVLDNEEVEIPVERYLGPTYLILGIFSSRSTVPREICIPIWPRHDLFEATKRGSNILQGVGRFFSLKYVSGFSIYRVGNLSFLQLASTSNNQIALSCCRRLLLSSRAWHTYQKYTSTAVCR